MPDYPDAGALNGVEAQLSKYPPLVFAGEARRLKAELAAASRGEAFLLQGGDCAESFAEFSADTIRDTFKVMLQMAMVLTYGAKVPVVKVGRMAGQFAKPRSAPTEMVGGVEMPSYKGDIINDIAPTMEARDARPGAHAAGLHAGRGLAEPAARVLDGRFRRHPPGAFLDAGLHRSRRCRALPRHREPHLRTALDFMTAAGLTGETNHELAPSISTPATRRCCWNTKRRSLPARFDLGQVARGLRPHDLDRRPHAAARRRACGVRRGVMNPIGLKCGPTTTEDDLKVLMAKLNPENEAGRLTLIARFGAGKVGDTCRA
jgi:3-deoxy-7-phosphoheptulonate synthase